MLQSGSANNWWERSPNGSNSTNFCNVNSNGNANNNNASNSNGVAFGFCSSSRKGRSDKVTGDGEISTLAEGELIPGKSQNDFENLYKAGRKCCRGVGWKCSTQRYVGDLITNTARTHRELMDGTWRTKGFHEFDLMERGKLRHIRSVHITERVVQRCLCDEVLVPVFSAAFIYDNAASLKDKGIDFAMNRMDAQLQRHIRKHGLTGGILVYDFKDFFNSAPHAPIYEELEKRVHDPRIRSIACGLMEDFGERGFGLGSQVSQIDALMLPNKLDHAIKEKKRVKGYGRYMDDGRIIHESIDYLKECLEELRSQCADAEIQLNEKKTYIVPLRQGVKFLKTKFKPTESGKIVRKMNRRGTRKMREKLKKFRVRLDEGTMTREDIRTSYESWRGHMRRGDSWRVLRRMDRFYESLFGEGGQSCTK